MRGLTIIFCLFLPVLAYAQYETPDSWRLHYNANGMKATMEGIDIKGGTLQLNTSVRNDFRFTGNESDNDLHTYVRGRLSGVQIGNGELLASFNVRASTDTSGRIRDPRYYALFDSLDSARGEDKWNLRLYNAFITIDQIIPYTKLSGGRVYIEHLTDLQIDGGDLVIGTENYHGFVYYGLPVSYYLDDMNTQVVGGGAELNFFDSLKIRAEVMQFMVDSDDRFANDYGFGYELGEDTLFFKLRGDYTYDFNIARGTVYAAGGMLEDAIIYEFGTFGTLASTGTVYSAYLKGQYDRNTDTQIAAAISEFDAINGVEAQHIQFGIQLHQGFAENYAVGLGYETRYNFDTHYGDRDYHRVMANFDLIQVIPNSYISITGEYWLVPQYNDYVENNKFYMGGRYSQIITEEFEAWLGASLMNYRYFYKQYDRLPGVNQPNDKLNNSVYVVYLGAGWTPVEGLLVQVDYTYEASQIIKEFDADNNKISTVSAIVSYNF